MIPTVAPAREREPEAYGRRRQREQEEGKESTQNEKVQADEVRQRSTEMEQREQGMR